MTLRVCPVILMATIGCAPAPPTPPPLSSPAAVHVEKGVLVRDAPATPTCPPAPASAASARLRVVHDDEVSTLRLIGAIYALDGNTVATRSRDVEIPDRSSAVVLDADVPTGCHLIEATLDYFTRFPTPWGYDYVFRMRSVRAITVTSGESSVRIVSTDARGGVMTPIEDRLGIRWEAP